MRCRPSAPSPLHGNHDDRSFHRTCFLSSAESRGSWTNDRWRCLLKEHEASTMLGSSGLTSAESILICPCLREFPVPSRKGPWPRRWYDFGSPFGFRSRRWQLQMRMSFAVQTFLRGALRGQLFHWRSALAVDIEVFYKETRQYIDKNKFIGTWTAR